ncbi:MAG TPA: hypothetical protein VLC98_13700 [Phnomibacter sp.]|nr:hypothetical protein [Phnomibacter sp.]
MRYILFIFFLHATLWCSAQQKPIRIVLTDSTGNAVRYASVKVQRHSNKSIVLWQNMRDTNTVELQVPVHANDSLLFTVQSTGYITYTCSMLPSSSLPAVLPVTLQLAHSTLPNVVVTGPPVWRRGDTTFYKVDAFKTGEEKKLKDVLEKLPDFSFDKNGNLLYKQKAVEKIMIEGNEIFAQKLDLLLTSFPVHVLEQVQALENQTNQKLLKGLSGESRVFINLKLNNKKLQAAFGDVHLALGSNWRYQFSPVVFALQQKVQVAFIGNYNNLGEGFGWKAQEEIKTQPQKKMEGWLLNNLTLNTINNFDSRYYISNKLFDNRVQLNAPIGKKAQLKQEFSYSRDFQKQHSYFTSTLVADTSLIVRRDSNYYESKPNVAVSTTELTIQLKPNQELKTQAIFALNNTQNQEQNKYTQIAFPQQSLQQRIQNNWKQWIAMAEYTSRLNSNKAIKVWGMAAMLRLPQQGTAYSTQFPDLYPLPDSTFTHQQIAPKLATELIQGGATYYVKSGQKTHQYHGEASFSKFDYTSNGWFTQQNNADTIAIPALAQAQSQQLLHVRFRTSRSLEKGTTYFFANGELGGQQIKTLFNKTAAETKLYPSVLLDANARSRLTKNLNSHLMAKYTQELAQPYKMFEGILPTGLSQYRQYADYTLRPTQQLFTSAAITFHMPKNHGHLLSISNMLQFNSSAFYNNYIGFLQTTIDSITKNNTNITSLLYNYNYNNFNRNYRISASINYSFSSRLYIVNHQAAYGYSKLGFVSVSLHKSWKKKWFYFFETNYINDNIQLPENYTTNRNTYTQHLRFNTRLSWNATPELNVNAYCAYYNNNLGRANNYTFTIVDAEAQFKPAKKKYYFSLKARNLANIKDYKDINLSSLSQSIGTIPLMPRNILFGCYFNL